MKKKIFLIGLIAILLCGCGKVSKLKDGSDAVVSFDNLGKISVDELYDEVKNKYALNILIDMIDSKILNEVYKDKMEEADKYTDDYVKQIKDQYEEKEFDELLNNAGYATIKDFKEYIKLNYLRDLAVTDYAKEQITDKQIESYYESDIVGDIEASHILITVDAKDDATDEEKEKLEEEAKTTAEDIIKQLDEGADFAELAKKYSKDESNKNNGGSLGKFNKGDMELNFETAAYKLKVNEYTEEPIKTSYGYHIIKKTKEHDKKELKEVKNEIIETLSNELKATNQTISITALSELRKEKGMNIEDSELKSNYNKYLNSLYNYYNTTTSSK